MQFYKILHRTYYNYSSTVQLKAHTLRLRPREGPELHIQSSSLKITPPPITLRWLRDVEDNAVAIAEFEKPASQLLIESEIIIQQFNESPLDFLVADYAVDYPFYYLTEDIPVLIPYMESPSKDSSKALSQWISGFWQADQAIQTYTLLQKLCVHIQQTIKYQLREEPGVQSALETLKLGSGSCRDSAFLFMQAARQLGFAARFVSGYLHAEPSTVNYGSTHAWAEVFLPGAGWKGFDPTIGQVAGNDHIAVAVARSPEQIAPIEGLFTGTASSSLDVGVWVTLLDKPTDK